ncbi:hypothetical protein HELRODRAFT_166474 [Helobdella robusta]|uniref:Uncharacterized protein n=1 Tax=Helobdella robusta TaxID=6412 RepID=T1EY61_HELRO|nr:hypothetical protein HELRODRAFT_166474 [Helobdella robusta]ESO11481.1 hypothetical protein HELRODRAFT_166474 [Helobdella robusta]
MSESSDDYVKEILDLIMEHEDIDALLHEMNDNDVGAKYNASVLSEPSLLGLISLVEQNSSLLNSKLSKSSATVLSDALKKMTSSERIEVFIGDRVKENNVTVVMKACKHYIDKKEFSINTFAKNLNKEPIGYLPFELIWLLHSKGIMTLDLFFISNLKRPLTINSVSDSVYKLCSNSTTGENASDSDDDDNNDVGNKVTKRRHNTTTATATAAVAIAATAAATTIGRRDGLVVKVAWSCFAVTGFEYDKKIPDYHMLRV